MRVMAFEGTVERGQIRLINNKILEDKTKVFVIIPDSSEVWEDEKGNEKQGILTFDSLEILQDNETFSISDNSFFAIPPQALGKTTPNEIDEIIAKEAGGA